MATLKKHEHESSDDVLARQKSKPVLFLEGGTDLNLFTHYWFNEEQEFISFCATGTTDGCAAVVRTVKECRRAQKIKAFGLVDRDKLMSDRHWALVRETDDIEFEKKQTYPNVKVLLRWEMENYLLEPAALEQCLANRAKGRKRRTNEEVAQSLLTHAEALIPFAALNHSLHGEVGREPPGDGYCRKLPNRSAVEAEIESDLKHDPVLLSNWQQHIPHIDAFSADTAETATQKLEALLRIVNGKAMFLRIKAEAKFTDDIHFDVALQLRQSNRIPTEIKEFVKKCYENPQ